MVSRAAMPVIGVISAILFAILCMHMLNQRYLIPSAALPIGATCLAAVVAASGVSVARGSREVAVITVMTALVVIAVLYSNLIPAIAAAAILGWGLQRGQSSRRLDGHGAPLLVAMLAGVGVAYLVPLATLPAPVSACDMKDGFPTFPNWYIPGLRSQFEEGGNSRVVKPGMWSGSVQSEGVTYTFTCDSGAVTAFKRVP